MASRLVRNGRARNPARRDYNPSAAGLACAFCLLVVLIGLSSRASAHEFWLDPEPYRAQTGAKVTIAHRNGEHFKGSSYPYVKEWFHRFVVADGNHIRDVHGRLGDIPAATLVFAEPGLKVVGYHATSDSITYGNWQKFSAFLKLEGLQAMGPIHRAQGKPETGIREIYERCAKALIAIGAGAGEDRALGLPLELIAEKNPYALKPGDPLPVRLLYRGKPLEGATVKAFNTVTPKAPARILTDAEGRALIPLPHAGPYLLNAVQLVEPEGDEKAHWKSWWASLTFAVSHP
jgi:uncharacterized GH25 family protein